MYLVYLIFPNNSLNLYVTCNKYNACIQVEYN